MVFFSLGILEFPTMLSLSLTGGSLYGILEFFVMSSPSPFGGSLYGILEFSVMRSPDQVGDDTRLENLEFPKSRHCEALKKLIPFIKP